MKGIITLCGSTRFKEEFNKVNLELTLNDYIVLSVGSFLHSDKELSDRITPEVKIMLDRLHKEKIYISKSIVVINKNGYVGESTKSEIEFAWKNHKLIYIYERYPLPFNFTFYQHWSELLK